MAEFNVEVRGDPALLNQAGFGFSATSDVNNGAVGVSMGMGAPAVGFQVYDNGNSANVSVNMNMGMPGMSMHVHDGQGSASISMGMPTMTVTTTNVVAAPAVTIQAPIVSLEVPAAIGFSIGSAPAPAPAMVFGNDWQVTVQNPHTVGNAGEDQHTTYDFVLRTNLAEYGNQQYHLRHRRYTEFPDKNFFGRFDSGVISVRMRAFQAMFDIIASDQRMRTCQLVKDFFFGSTTFGAPVKTSF